MRIKQEHAVKCELAQSMPACVVILRDKHYVKLFSLNVSCFRVVTVECYLNNVCIVYTLIINSFRIVVSLKTLGEL